MSVRTCGHWTRVDQLVKGLTAFSSLKDMHDSMIRGYVPTIYPKSWKHRSLINVIRRLGFRVFSGI